MKRKFTPLLLLLVLSIMVSLVSISNSAVAAQIADVAETSVAATNSALDMTAKVTEINRLISEAKAQVEAKDYTPLSEPVKYKILWLGFTRVTYEQLDFRMTEFDKEYLRSVVLNFEKVVEEYSNHNIDIEVDLYFVDTAKTLTNDANAGWLYLAQETVQSEIDQYNASGKYDTVLTTVQTKGEENRLRNEGKPGYGTSDVVLGLKTAGIENVMGYSTFNLWEPVAGTYPLQDPKVPSLYATAVAIHEWMHQLEYIGEVLDIEYPSTHAYRGGEEFPGYQEYIAGKNNYDYCEFYELVLGGKLPYTGNGSVQYVGMYPKMWKLIKRDVLNIGEFTFKSATGEYYLTGQLSEPSLTMTSEACKWLVRYSNKDSYILIPVNILSKRIDLANAWDIEGNNVGLCYPTGYVNAQSWKLTQNADGTYCIRTAYSSGRAITINEPGAQAVIKNTDVPTTAQKWIISESGTPTVTPTQAPTVTPVSENTTTIYYKGYSTPYIHYKIGNGNWTNVPGVQMETANEVAGYTHKITINLGTADNLTVCFNDGNGNWDSCNGANYTFNAGTYTYSNGVITAIPEVTPTITQKPTVTPIAQNATTIYYKGYNTPYIHYKIGNGNWTNVPGVQMETANEVAGYTHKITIDLGTADNLTVCFNDGNGNWDSRNGANYTFNAGTYTYSNGVITAISEVTPTGTPTVTPIAQNATTIYYKGYNTPYIHYKIGDGNWTDVPGVLMEATAEMPGYTHKITINLGNSTDLIVCFNDGNGNWDSRNGANYNFKTGTYSYSNGNITKIN